MQENNNIKIEDTKLYYRWNQEFRETLNKVIDLLHTIHRSVMISIQILTYVKHNLNHKVSKT